MLLEQGVYRFSPSCSNIKYKEYQAFLEMAPRPKMLLAKIGTVFTCGTENKREIRELAIFAVFSDGWMGTDGVELILRRNK